MNPLTNMKNVLKLSENELKSNSKSSWHDMYKDSAWIFVGGFPYELTEGDIISIFSQYGEIVNINLVRDKVTGKSKGFCFICYQDQRSTILSVDNLNGIKILKRTLRVDHVSEYKVPKIDDKIDQETRLLRMEGCAPKAQIQPENVKKEKRNNSPAKRIIENTLGLRRTEIPVSQQIKSENSNGVKVKKEKKSKKDKKNKKSKKSKKEKKAKKKKNKHKSSSSDDSDSEERTENDDSIKIQKPLKRHTRSRSRDNECKRSRHR